MVLGTVICLLIPASPLGLFAHTEATIQSRETALRIISAGLSSRRFPLHLPAHWGGLEKALLHY